MMMLVCQLAISGSLLFPFLTLGMAFTLNHIFYLFSRNAPTSKDLSLRLWIEVSYALRGSKYCQGVKNKSRHQLIL